MNSRPESMAIAYLVRTSRHSYRGIGTILARLTSSVLPDSANVSNMSPEVLFSETGFLHLRGTGHIPIRPFLRTWGLSRIEKSHWHELVEINRGVIHYV